MHCADFRECHQCPMPLIHDSIEFHNASALEQRLGMPGLCPVRFPRELRTFLNAEAPGVPLDMVGVELRFVVDGRRAVQVALAAHAGEVTVHVYFGDHGYRDVLIPSGTTQVLQLDPPVWLSKVPREQLFNGAFSPDVWRIQIHRGTVWVSGIETFGAEIRPPRPDELPKLRYLAYGSSITHANADGYPHQAAKRLGVDVLNKGLSGSCHCEPELAEHLASSESWDFATLELGVNMRKRFTTEEFAGRAEHLVTRLRSEKPRAPLFLITHFTNRDHFGTAPDQASSGECQNAFDKVLRDMVSGMPGQNIHIIEGREILPSLTGLSADLLHPDKHGHVLMGENLARHLARHLSL